MSKRYEKKIYKIKGKKKRKKYNHIEKLSEIILNVKNFIRTAKFENALKLAYKILQIAKANDDIVYIGIGYRYIGIVYYHIGDYTQSYVNLIQSLNIFKDEKVQNEIAKTLMSLGKLFGLKKEYRKAIEFLESSLKLLLLIDDKINIAITLGNIGNGYHLLGEYQKALKYKKESLKILQSIGDNYNIGLTFGNIGNIFGDLKNYSKALNYQMKALKIFKDEDYIEFIALFYYNIGITYQKILKPVKAYNFFKRSLKVYYNILNNFNNVDLKFKFQNTFKHVPPLINSIQKLRLGDIGYEKIFKSSKEGSLEFWYKSGRIPKIKNLLIKTIDDIIVASNAKELFDFKIKNLEIIIKHLDYLKTNQKRNGDIEFLLIQQLIVILITAFEIYLKLRFIELENENNIPDLNKLYNFFIPSSIRERIIIEIKNDVIKKGISELEAFIDRGFISFQAWNDIEKAYLLGYGINIYEFGINHDVFKKMYHFLELRQRIIHSAIITPNYLLKVNSNSKELSINKELAKLGLIIFKEYINKFHSNFKEKVGIIQRDDFKKISIQFKISKELTAKEIFDNKMDYFKSLIEYVEKLKNNNKKSYIFETIIYQQIIVVLVSAFEVYTQNRFLEIQKEGKKVNIDQLYKRFIYGANKEQIINEIKNIAKKKLETELSILLSKRFINFQNWDHFKTAYNKGYDLVIGFFFEKSKILEDIQKYIKWRHKIIHSKIESPVLNFETSPPDKPIFINNILIKEVYDNYSEFINKFHKATKNLTQLKF